MTVHNKVNTLLLSLDYEGIETLLFDCGLFKDTLRKFTKNHFEDIYPSGVKFFIISFSPVTKGRTQWTDFPLFDFDKDIIYPQNILGDINKIASSDIEKLEQSLILNLVSLSAATCPFVKYSAVGMEVTSLAPHALILHHSSSESLDF